MAKGRAKCHRHLSFVTSVIRSRPLRDFSTEYFEDYRTQLRGVHTPIGASPTVERNPAACEIIDEVAALVVIVILLIKLHHASPLQPTVATSVYEPSLAGWRALVTRGC